MGNDERRDSELATQLAGSEFRANGTAEFPYSPSAGRFRENLSPCGRGIYIYERRASELTANR